jgi:hypothetical protein
MSVAAVLLPVFVQVGLTFVLLFRMGAKRLGVLRAGEVSIPDIALAQPNWPAPATQAANAYHNQFQIPVLFYALVALALLTRRADLAFVAMSWLFVALRVAHAYVHVTSNHVPTRFRAFVAGSLVLMAMWIVFALRILAGGAPL